jgi:hypothetical protein
MDTRRSTRGWSLLAAAAGAVLLLSPPPPSPWSSSSSPSPSSGRRSSDTSLCTLMEHADLPTHIASTTARAVELSQGRLAFAPGTSDTKSGTFRPTPQHCWPSTGSAPMAKPTSDGHVPHAGTLQADWPSSKAAWHEVCGQPQPPTGFP